MNGMSTLTEGLPQETAQERVQQVGLIVLVIKFIPLKNPSTEDSNLYESREIDHRLNPVFLDPECGILELGGLIFRIEKSGV
jgi:hypothetical protein